MSTTSDALPERVTLEFLGQLLRTIQAEQRTLRGENQLIRSEIGRLRGDLATRADLAEVLRVLGDRMGGFEATMETRFDQVLGQMAAVIADEFARREKPQS